MFEILPSKFRLATAIALLNLPKVCSHVAFSILVKISIIKACFQNLESNITLENHHHMCSLDYPMK